jgi:hypothetical protein
MNLPSNVNVPNNISNDDSSSYEVEYDLLISSNDSISNCSFSESMDDHQFIDHVIEKYGYYDKIDSDDSDYEGESVENLFEQLFDDLKEGKDIHYDPHEIMKSVPIAYLYSYYDTIYETMRAAFGEDIDNSSCVQLFNGEIIDHDGIMMDYSISDENTYLVGTTHSVDGEECMTYCIGLSIQNDDGENIHNECSCGNYGDMKYIKHEMYINF